MSDLAPAAVVPRLRGALGRPYVHRQACPSTQHLVLGAGLPAGATAVAEHQTAGRGRRGTAWTDAPGRALLCSVLLSTRRSGPSPHLSLVVGLAVAEALEEVARVSTSVKWPNDVLVEGRKLAGILLEQQGDELACGIGVNVNQRPSELPVDARTEPTSLRVLSGHDHDRGVVLAGILARVELRLEDVERAGLVAVLPALARRDALRGQRVSVGGSSGLAAGFTPEGALLLELDDGVVVAVASGEVSVERVSADRDG